MLCFLFFFVVLVQSQRKQYANLPEIRCNAASPVDLEVRFTRITIDNQVTFTTRAYHYNGQPYIPSPTLRITAGQPCNVTITNAMTGDACITMNNVPECPNSTNLHFHGVHMSPDKDAVFVPIQPGQNYTFDYSTLPTHLMGTHWYHPHFHGSSALQVTGGMHGAFLVDPSDDYVLPSDLQALYNNEYVVVLSFFFFGPSDTFTGAFPMVNYQTLVEQTGDTVASDINFLGQEKSFYTVNGLYQPYVPMVAGVAQLFRIVHTSGFRIFEMELVDPNNWCTMTMIARDGVFQFTPYQVMEAIVIPQAGRADVAILCSSAAAGHTVDVQLYPDPSRDQWLGIVNRFSQSILMTLNISANAGRVVPVPTSQASFPTDYLSSLMSTNQELSTSSICPANFYAFGFGLVRTAADEFGSINGNVWPGWTASVSHRYVDTFCLNKTYQLTINVPNTGPGYGASFNATGAHPIHLHTNPYQMVNGDGTSNGVIYRQGEWRDTIPAAVNSSIEIRWRPVTYTGEVPFHCHIYEHSDRGMMGIMNVVDTCETPSPCSITVTPTVAPVPITIITTTPTDPYLPPDSGSSLVPSLIALGVPLLFFAIALL